MIEFFKLIFILIFIFTPDILWSKYHFEDSGKLSFETFYFHKDDHKQETKNKLYSINGMYEASFNSYYVDGELEIETRADQRITERSYINIKSLYITYINKIPSAPRFTLDLGFMTLNWSKMEGFHPADTINSEYIDQDLGERNKKGELLLRYSFEGQFGDFALFYLPYFSTPDLGDTQGRLSFGGGDLAMYANEKYFKDENKAISQYAARWSLPVSAFDMDLHFARHIDRKFPVYGTHNYGEVLNTYYPKDSIFKPYYFMVTQLGGAFEMALDSIILKTEFSSRNFNKKVKIFSVQNSVDGINELAHQKDHIEAAAGIEYGFDFERGYSLSTFLEYSKMTGLTKKERVQMSLTQHDLFFAMRLNLNNIKDSTFEWGILYDLDIKGEYLSTFDFSKRINDKMKYEIGYRYFNIKSDAYMASQILKDNHYFHFKISRFF